MDAEENQRQVFLRAHSPWKSQTTRFPHSHSRCSAWKSGKPKAGFPLSHWLFLLFNQIKKGNPAADRFAPASRLILQLENAVRGQFHGVTRIVVTRRMPFGSKTLLIPSRSTNT